MKRGGPQNNWSDVLEGDLKIKITRNVHATFRDRKKWRWFVMEAKAHNGLGGWDEEKEEEEEEEEGRGGGVEEEEEAEEEEEGRGGGEEEEEDRLLNFFKTFYATAATAVIISLTKSKGFTSVCTVRCALCCFHYCRNDKRLSTNP